MLKKTAGENLCVGYDVAERGDAFLITENLWKLGNILKILNTQNVLNKFMEESADSSLLVIPATGTASIFKRHSHISRIV